MSPSSPEVTRTGVVKWYPIGYHFIIEQLDIAINRTMNSIPTNLRFGELIRTTRQRANLGLRELARRAGTSHATLSAYENGRKLPSIATFVRLLEACGYAVDFNLSKRIRQHNGLKRGEELAEVLTLAEQFPAKPARRLNFPRFDQTAR